MTHTVFRSLLQIVKAVVTLPGSPVQQRAAQRMRERTVSSAAWCLRRHVIAVVVNEPWR